MSRLAALKVKIFADGAHLEAIKRLSAQPWVKGFTTNPTLMRKAGVIDYKSFALEVLQVVSDRPVSFEVFADDFDEMERQAYVQKVKGRRAQIQAAISELLKKREAFIRAERKRLGADGDGFDQQVSRIVREQASRKGIAYKN